MMDERSRNGVIIRERYEDGAATAEELAHATDAAVKARGEIRQSFRFASNLQEDSPEVGPAYAAGAACNTAAGNHHPVSWYVTSAAACISGLGRNEVMVQEATFHSLILRDIAGPLPFRPVTIDPRWQSSTVLDLARTIYEQRTFEHLPILADALMDAGCDNEDIIQHCQSKEPHVRGCWVLDLLLGKE
jgi:hypothetical protein